MATPLEWVGYTWLAVLLYLIFATLAWNRSGSSCCRRNGRRSADTDAGSRRADCGAAPIRLDADRRSVAAVAAQPGLAVTAGALAVAAVGTGAWFANSAPVVRRVPITLAGLDPAFDGFRIVTISDVHLSSTYGGRQFRRVIDLVNAQRPDIVAIVGDLVDGDLDELGGDAAMLADLVSEQGVFFVTGNHEYYVDTENWMQYLPTLGVRVLRNERVTLRRGDAALDLAGIDDRTAADSGVPGHGADLDAALAGRDETVPVVLLAHQPAQVEQAAAAGVDLQLSGHTHGAQMWPFEYIIALDQPLLAGLGQFGDTQLYVTTGTGYWGPAVRLGSRPEISVIELRSPQPDQPAGPRNLCANSTSSAARRYRERLRGHCEYLHQPGLPPRPELLLTEHITATEGPRTGRIERHLIMSTNVWFITGAARGMGIDIAKAALDAGHSRRRHRPGRREGHRRSSATTRTCWPCPWTSPTEAAARPPPPPPSSGSAASTSSSTTPATSTPATSRKSAPRSSGPRWKPTSSAR